MASLWLMLSSLWLADLYYDWETPGLHWILGYCGLTWPVGISTVSQTPLTFSRQMSVVKVVHGGCERDYWCADVMMKLHITQLFSPHYYYVILRFGVLLMVLITWHFSYTEEINIWKICNRIWLPSQFTSLQNTESLRSWYIRFFH